jgi:hypothetical protein
VKKARSQRSTVVLAEVPLVTTDICARVNLLGIPAITSYWQTLAVLVPDEILSIDEVTVRTEADSISCHVSCRYAYRGTILFDTKLPGHENVIGGILSSIYQEYNELSRQAFEEVTHADQDKVSLNEFNPVYSPSFSAVNLVHMATSRYGAKVIQGTTTMSADGFISIQIDEDRRIQSIDFITAAAA